MKFKECRDCLYFFGNWKTANTNNVTVTNYSVAHYRFLNTVENNEQIYTW